MNKSSEQKRFSVVARMKSVSNAWRGLRIVFSTQHNAWIHILASFASCMLGVVFHIHLMEWMVLVMVIGLVWVAETFNTAMEIDIDLTSPTYHPYARDTKDVAAGAVLLSSLCAVIVGCMIFLPRIFALIF